MQPRWIWIALGLSLLVNVFLLGVGVTRYVQFKKWEAMRAELERNGGDANRPAPLKALPRLTPESQAVLREAMVPRLPDMRGSMEAQRNQRRAIVETLEKEPFDREALAALLAKLRESTNQSQLLVHEAVLEAALKLSPEQRRALAGAVQNPRLPMQFLRGQPGGVPGPGGMPAPPSLPPPRNPQP